MKKLPFKMIVETGIEKYRHDTFWTKEPETLAWIDSFALHDTFIDVGANIGLYSLYAASKCVLVLAFEPNPYNYSRFMDNILLNDFDNLVPHHMAVGCDNSNVRIYIPDNTVGATGTQIESPIDEHDEEFKPKAVMTVGCVALEDLQGVNHIKIDVDGHEQDVVRGMATGMYRKDLKSILIECNSDKINIDGFKEYMNNFGFTTDNPFNSHPDHSRIRRKKEGIKAENIVFTRRAK